MGKAFRTALPRTSPVCISFFLLALSYGVLMGTRGFSFLWPMCMSAFIFTGSMEFVTVNLLVSAFNPFVTFMLAVMLGTRHLFYGISMLGRFKNMGAKKPYLIFSLCDETFAIDNGTIIAADSIADGSTSSSACSTSHHGWPAPRLAAFSENASPSTPPVSTSS